MVVKNTDSSSSSSSAARSEAFRRMEKQFHALQLQPLQDNGVSQQGTFIHQQPYNTQVQDVGTFGSNTVVQQQHPSNYQHGFINNYATNQAMGGLPTGHGHGYGFPGYEDYRIWQGPSIEATAAQRMHCFHTCRGSLVSMAMNRRDCRYIQQKIRMGNPTDVALILYEVKDSLHMLMTHPYGNHLIQKIFEARRGIITRDQKHSLVYLIISNYQKLRNVCMDFHGTRVMQIMLKNIKCLFMQYVVVYTMKHITVALMKNFNGSYVIVECLKLFPPEHQNFASANEQMVKELRGQFVRLSVNKYASNVVENLLTFSKLDDVEVIVEEIISSHDFLNVLQDPFGNYVAQRSLKCTQGHLRRKLSNLIISNHRTLHSHPYGKKVLTMANDIYGKKVHRLCYNC
ncbi:pumilio homolog 12 [Medicago truncatula]|uniref:pumilio homolog 12 n=1 Tax=Medicago truncatula TaxID=3880 RepID=UPI001966DC14|nr:pumilio homolog 12 [Medicago truncatula]